MSTPAGLRASMFSIFMAAALMVATSGCGRSGTPAGDGSTSGNDGQGGTSGARVPSSHRAQATSCEGVFAPAEPVNPKPDDSCQRHADCTQGKNGRCIYASLGSRGSTFRCIYDECATDADCASGQVCFCAAGNSPRCFALGNCRIDADCGGGTNGFCSPAFGDDCGGNHWYVGYYCHTPHDTCLDDSDCSGDQYCDFDAVEGRWECKSPNRSCFIG